MRPESVLMRLLCGLFAAVCFAGCSSERVFFDLTGEFSAAPAALDFGAVVAGGGSLTRDLLVTNSGSTGLSVEVGAPDDPAFTVGGELSYEIPSDETVAIPVTFAPGVVAEFSALLPFTTDDPDNEAATVPLVGVGRVPYAPDIEIRPVSGVDFGEVAVGDEPQAGFFEVANVGDANLVLGSVVQSGAGTFQLSRDFSGTTLAPGDVLAVLLHYAPVQPDGDSGTITIPSNDADEPSVDVPLTANGGGTFEYPLALIDCPGTVNVAGETLLVLDGSASYDPLGYPLTYAWDVVRRPNGADEAAEVSPSDAAVGTLVLGAAGTWEASLTVTNSLGTPSVPAKCVIEAVPMDELHVELAWGGATSDLDLHLAQEDGAFYAVPDDVSWCNPAPDWGLAGLTDDDPLLAIDDSFGFGPEQIGVTVPADGTYPVRVHLFDDGEDGDVTATVSVFSYGALVWSGSKVLSRNEVWDVGQVNWPEGSFGVATTAPWDADGTRGCL
jgi:hypothetical protein